jgi:luciferase family oxidoreductase group 1
MKLSVLDQSPVSAGSDAGQALGNTVELAQAADRLGFHRYWIAEHHAIEALASPAPELLIARIGAETSRIRIGSGGIMLPHYSAFKVAETFRVLHALYPGRIDLGVGRAPGGSPLESYALRRNRKEAPDDFPEQLTELLAFLHKDFLPSHQFAAIHLSPDVPGVPEVWLLGSSRWSAQAAAQFGLPYNFAHFIDPNRTREAIELYRRNFNPTRYGSHPEATLALGVICAETDGEAQRLAASARLLFRRVRQGDLRPVAPPEDASRELEMIPDAVFAQWFPENGEWPRYIVGSPERVKRELSGIARALQLEEIMVVTIVHAHRARLRSYELLSQAFALESAQTEKLAPAGQARG